MYIIINIFFYSRVVEVDYDTDDSGLYKAKSANNLTRGAKVILETSQTQIEMPIDLVKAETVEEENLEILILKD